MTYDLYRVFLLSLKNKLYSTGTKPSVRIEPTAKPPIITAAIGNHIAPPNRAIWIRPRMVVSVVSRLDAYALSKLLWWPREKYIAFP